MVNMTIILLDKAFEITLGATLMMNNFPYWSILREDGSHLSKIFSQGDSRKKICSGGDKLTNQKGDYR